MMQSLKIGTEWLVAASLVLGVVPVDAAPANETAVERARVQFLSELRPLLAVQCWSCHSAMKQEGGLRLDTREGWERGGFSKKNLLEKNFEQNELLRRLQTLDPDERMPLGHMPLPEHERALIESWLQADAPWVDTPPEKSAAAAPTKSWQEQSRSWLEAAIDYDYRYLKLAFYAAIGLFFFVLAIEWAYERAKKQGQSRDQMRGLAGLAAHLRPYAYLFALAGVAMLGLVLHHLKTLELLAANQARQSQVVVQTPQPMIFGAPEPESGRPLYLRAKAPPRFGGVYYRGNDERSPELFNGGYYRTATLRLDLCSMDRKPLQPGDAVTPPLQLRLIIEKAKGASPQLFSRQLMSRAILTFTPPTDKNTGTFLPEHFLEEVHAGEKWQVFLTLPEEGPRSSSGDAYLVAGNFDSNAKYTGAAHFLIHYDLQTINGKLEPNSELWLAATLFPNNLQWTSKALIAANEWYDFLPIPEIEGPNSTDPELLGLPEHEKRIGAKLRERPEPNSPPQAVSEEELSEKP